MIRVSVGGKREDAGPAAMGIVPDHDRPPTGYDTGRRIDALDDDGLAAFARPRPIGNPAMSPPPTLR